MEVFSFIIGAVFGSFLNLLTYRLPQNLSIITPRSYCEACKKSIKWFHNIPIISYILLKGKCNYCNQAISIEYFLIELITAFLTLFLFLKLGLSYELLFSLIFFYTLIVLSFIDFKYKAVPDYLLMIIFILSFVVSSNALVDAFKGAFIISGAFILLNFVVTFYIQNIKYKFTKDESLKEQQALGEGDIPVLASFGAILGVEGAFVAIFLGAVFAIIPSIYFNIIKKDIQTPFIPYLALGFVFEYFFNLSKVFH